nr:hypothetical protein [Escherichia fergusonii]
MLAAANADPTRVTADE